MFTLQQRVNVAKGVAIDTPVEFHEKIDACLKNLSGKFIKGDLVAAAIPMIDVFNPSFQQLTTWALRVLDGNGMSYRMTSSIISDPAFEAQNINSSDAIIEAGCMWSIAAYAAKV
jgi:hypothetical protein